MDEYRCLLCGETFLMGADDARESMQSEGAVVHWFRSGELEGQECGGIGKLAESWQSLETAQMKFLHTLFDGGR